LFLIAAPRHRYGNHSVVFVGYRKNWYTLEILSKDVSTPSMSSGQPRPLIHRIVVLPAGFVPAHADYRLLPSDASASDNADCCRYTCAVVVGDGTQLLGYNFTAVIRRNRGSIETTGMKAGSAEFDMWSKDGGETISRPGGLQGRTSLPILGFKARKLFQVNIQVDLQQPIIDDAVINAFAHPLRKLVVFAAPFVDTVSVSLVPPHLVDVASSDWFVSEWFVKYVAHRTPSQGAGVSQERELCVCMMDSAGTIWIVQPSRSHLRVLAVQCDDVQTIDYSDIMKERRIISRPCAGLSCLLLQKSASNEAFLWFPCGHAVGRLTAPFSTSLVPTVLMPLKVVQYTAQLRCHDADEEDMNDMVQVRPHKSSSSQHNLLCFQSLDYLGQNGDSLKVNIINCAFSLALTALDFAFCTHNELVRILKGANDSAKTAGPSVPGNTEGEDRLRLVKELGCLYLDLCIDAINSAVTDAKQLNFMIIQFERVLLMQIHELAELKSSRSKDYKMAVRKYRVVMSALCFANEDLFFEVLSRLCRKIEPEISMLMFPLPIRFVKKASSTHGALNGHSSSHRRPFDACNSNILEIISDPHACLFETKMSLSDDECTSSALAVLEMALSRRRLELGARLLTMACEAVGGSETCTARCLSLILSLELLWVSIGADNFHTSRRRTSSGSGLSGGVVNTGRIYTREHAPSLSVALQCAEFCLRLESLMLATVDDRMLRVFEGLCVEAAENNGLLNVCQILKQKAVGTKHAAARDAKDNSQLRIPSSEAQESTGWWAFVASYFMSSSPTSPRSTDADRLKSMSNDSLEGPPSPRSSRQASPRSDVTVLNARHYGAFGKSADYSFCSQISRNGRDQAVAGYCIQSLRLVTVALEHLVESGQVMFASALQTVFGSSMSISTSAVRHVLYLFINGSLRDSPRVDNSLTASKRIVHEALIAFHVDKALSLNAIRQKLSQFVTDGALRSVCRREHAVAVGAGEQSMRLDFPDVLFSSWQSRTGSGQTTHLLPVRRTFTELLRSYCWTLFSCGHMVECAALLALGLQHFALAADVLTLHELLLTQERRLLQAAPHAARDYRQRGIVRVEPGPAASETRLPSNEDSTISDDDLANRVKVTREQAQQCISDRLVRVVRYFAPGGAPDLYAEVAKVFEASRIRWELVAAQCNTLGDDPRSHEGSDHFSVAPVLEACVLGTISGTARFSADKLLETMSRYFHPGA
jgi:hypothetical protein